MESSETHSNSLALSRDEMNLAEFPLAVLSTRIDGKVKTLEFSDSLRGKNGELTERRWIITGADKFGLPTASDDEVLLGLLKLTVDDGFRSQKVYFTRYELLRILHWTTEGRNYSRLQRALDRLSGVRIKATNAFYDNSQKAHHTKNFGIIDAYELNDGRDMSPKPSFFIWSETLFQSFQVGFIKKLDLDFYLSLKSAVSKRLYRYLDKHFWYRARIQINLFTLAHEKIGISRNYRFASSLKQQLEPACEELKAAGFLSEFEYLGRGQNTEVVFFARTKSPRVADRRPPVSALDAGSERAPARPSDRLFSAEGPFSAQESATRSTSIETGQRVGLQGAGQQEGSSVPSTAALDRPTHDRPVHDRVVRALIDRGISEAQAARLVLARTVARVEKMERILEYFDSLMKKGSPLVSKNPAGFLYRAIERVDTFKLPEQGPSYAAKKGTGTAQSAQLSLMGDDLTASGFTVSGGTNGARSRGARSGGGENMEQERQLEDLYLAERRQRVADFRANLSSEELDQISTKVRQGWERVRGWLTPERFEQVVQQGVDEELALRAGVGSFHEWRRKPVNQAAVRAH